MIAVIRLSCEKKRANARESLCVFSELPFLDTSAVVVAAAITKDYSLLFLENRLERVVECLPRTRNTNRRSQMEICLNV